MATFMADITPGLGDGPCIGFMPRVLTIEHPLHAKGLILSDNGGIYVLCALDYTGICNGTYDLFREKIGAAAGTSPSKVSVHSVHQHTAPVLDANGQRIHHQNNSRKLTGDLEFASQTADKIARRRESRAAANATGHTHRHRPRQSGASGVEPSCRAGGRQYPGALQFDEGSRSASRAGRIDRSLVADDLVP